ncbi:MAG: hypothetical protein HYV23_04115 [Deltaproteobacteria bacterium]|nr:hypothetical protein [Deltaproteobacteria bacterium]
MAEPADTRVFIHTVDADGYITAVNDEWVEFARENGAPELAREALVGRAIWVFIEGMETRHISRLLLDKARRCGKGLTIPYRCDSPDLKRFMEMEIVPLENGTVEFRSRLLKVEKREPVRLLDPQAGRGNEFLTICSWCRRARIASVWLELDEVVKKLDLFSSASLPQLTHGVFEDCSQVVRKKTRS